MVEVESGIENLRELERVLEKVLESPLEPDCPFPRSLHMSCAIREGHLMVLIHCPEATQPDSQTLFNRIRAVIARERPSQLNGLQLYLIIHGQRILAEGRDGSVFTDLSNAVSLPVQFWRQNYFQEQNSFLRNIQEFPYQVGKKLRYLRDRPFSLPMLAIGSGSIVALIGLYALTRPCVIGHCWALPESAQRVTEAEQILNHATTISDLQTAQGQLDQAIRQLQGIPPWSGEYDQALLHLGNYQQQSHQLSQVLASLRLDDQAQTLAQKPSLTPSEIQHLQKLWRSALSYLQAIPAQSPLSALAQTKLLDYQAHLTQLTQDVRQRETAIATLQRAEEAATLAQSRQKTASSLQDWQSVTATWSTVLKLLRQVPADSSSADAARQAINRYLPFWVNANQRQQVEQAAQRRYQQASQASQAAQTAQAKQQDAQAVLFWQQAIAYLTAIPPQSLPFPAAQTLLPTYRRALAQAQAQRDRKTELETIRQELAQICQNPAKICDYTLSDNQIRLTLTAAYLAQVWNSSLAAQAQANVPNQMAILNHVARLEQNLQLLSQKTGLPIEVYNPQGIFISRYEVR